MNARRNYEPMTGAELATIRRGLGLSVRQLQEAVCYTDERKLRRMEADQLPIPPTLALLVRMYERYGVDAGVRRSTLGDGPARPGYGPLGPRD